MLRIDTYYKVLTKRQIDMKINSIDYSDMPIHRRDGHGYRLLETRRYGDGEIVRVWGEFIVGRDGKSEDEY